MARHFTYAAILVIILVVFLIWYGWLVTLLVRPD